jgi:predicted nucleotidyltransferase component of viral defense system
MDKSYADTVRLLLTVAPEVFANDIFAMKGGTAINLFVQDMPRLSVDIDVVFQPRQVPRDEAVAAIDAELAAIGQRVASLGLRARRLRGADAGDTKLIVENDTSQVKIEVNTVFRGTVLPIERRPLNARTGDLFGVEFDAPILARDELYAGKLVAALDRQHPRDLFDVWQLYESGGLTDAMVECFVVYLAGHNRPLHEVLFGNDKDIAAEYERAFVGMTEVPCSLNTLLDARARMRLELPAVKRTVFSCQCLGCDGLGRVLRWDGVPSHPFNLQGRLIHESTLRKTAPTALLVHGFPAGQLKTALDRRAGA